MNTHKQISRIINRLPTELQGQVIIWFQRLQEKYPSMTINDLKNKDDLIAVIKLVACSEFVSDILIKHWEYYIDNINQQIFSKSLNPEQLSYLFSKLKKKDITEKTFLQEIRKIRNQCLIHILWRDVVNSCELDETLTNLTLLAEYSIKFAAQYATDMHESVYGSISHEGRKIAINILAMGKLGGSELNFSSDVDLIFLYPENGYSNGKNSLTAQDYFSRLARKIVYLLNENTSEGFVYRVDTRLRPFGESGSLVISYEAFENYLLKHGRDWERYAYVKARLIYYGEQENEENKAIYSMVTPFVFRKYLDYGILESLRGLKFIIESEVAKKNLVEDIKLGPGGIREIEFIVQSIQLIRGGNSLLLRQPQLKHSLNQAIKEHDLGDKIGRQLYIAYCFLRKLENYIQCIRDQQTHKLPNNIIDKTRLMIMMGYKKWDHLVIDHEKYKNFITKQFSELIFRQEDNDLGELTQKFRYLLRQNASQVEWNEILSNLNQDLPKEFAEILFTFLCYLNRQKIDKITYQRFEQLIPNILLNLVKTDKPVVTLERLISIFYQILRRSAYIAFLNENSVAMIRLIELCEKSSYLTEMIARTPLLLDEMLNPSDQNLEKLNEQLSQNLFINSQINIENQANEISLIQRNAIFNIAIKDLDGNIPIMKVSDKLTQIAELTINSILKSVYQEFILKYGEPEYILNGVKKKANFGIVAYGKLGGLELSYGSDLDLVFLHDSEGDDQFTNGKSSIDNDIFFSRLSQKLILLLTTQTNTGALYNIDTRLRPSGNSGLLISSIKAFDNYQRDKAWVWEHQALLRSRIVAGSTEIIETYNKIRREVLMYSIDHANLKNEVLKMRIRMRGQLDKSNDDTFDLKNGVGGIGDIEFLVQYLVLLYARRESGLIFFTDNIRQLDALSVASIITSEQKNKLQEIYKNFRRKIHLLNLNGKSNIIHKKDFHSEREVVINMWNDYFNK